MVQESATLDLARDYSRFVITFLDLINTSASHIYISALPLSPQTSMIKKTYKKYEKPLARVVRGLSPSWEPVVATRHHEIFHGCAAWSPCHRFIAVAKDEEVEVCDAVTLHPLSTLKYPAGFAFPYPCLSFSPDSHFLTQFGNRALFTWDLQTGSLVHPVLSTELNAEYGQFSSTYSMDGKTIAFVCTNQQYDHTLIATHDLFGTDTHIYCVSNEHFVHQIWTHDKFLQFSTVKLGCITIWQVEFTLRHTPEMVESFSIPDEITTLDESTMFLFLPALSRLAITSFDSVLIWDVQNSKLLLNVSSFYPDRQSFSSNGHFYACTSIGTSEVHVWKESPVGYILHQKVPFLDTPAHPLLSPNGESIVLSLPSKVHLWHTKDPIHSSNPNLGMNGYSAILEFFPNEASAAFAQHRGDRVMGIDLQSGVIQWSLETGMEVIGLGVTESTIIIVGKSHIQTWTLVAGKPKDDSIQIIILDQSQASGYKDPFYGGCASVHPGCSHIAISVYMPNLSSYGLKVYDTSTGRCLAGVSTKGEVRRPCFTPDGCEIWEVHPLNKQERWKVIEDSKSGVAKLQLLEGTVYPQAVLPWQSSLGYEVTDNEWILSPTKKRLLWLPHQWRWNEKHKTWNRQFLWFLHPQKWDLVILEFLD